MEGQSEKSENRKGWNLPSPLSDRNFEKPGEGGAIFEELKHRS